MNFPDNEEFKLISVFQKTIHAQDLNLGIGDDAAIVDPFYWKGKMLVAHDQLIEGIHFRLDWSNPDQVAHKLVISNLSDMNAMGGVARYALLSMALPQFWDKSKRMEWARAIDRVASSFGLKIIGGDTTASIDKVSLGMTLLGELEGQALLRSSARPGHLLLLTSPMGASAAGLYLLAKAIDDPRFSRLVQHHLSPQWSGSLGPKLAKQGQVGAVLDLSDDLYSSLEHIAQQSMVALEVDIDCIPVSDGLFFCADLHHQNPWDWILGGGEEYALLLTLPQNHPMIPKNPGENNLWIIGRVESGEGVELYQNKKLFFWEKKSFKHF